MTKRIIEIEITENTASDIADILCWFSGFLEAKGDSYANNFLKTSLNSLIEVNMQIKKK